MKSILEARFWNGWHGLYRAEAAERLEQLRQDAKALAEEGAALRERIGPPASTIEAISSARESLSVDSMLIHVLSCMAIEAFLNHYGVASLGEAFFKRNCERASASQKCALVLLATTGRAIPEDCELLTVVSRLFNQRNAFVHPKARAAESSHSVAVASLVAWTDHRVPSSAERSVGDMYKFFELFVAADPRAAECAKG